ncbi:SMR domain-containing protein [Apiospora rasikravindrae]|uniref:SMR domain-containing protein n=1 Tax=Apiospora rasikravindrae TaxID=990691 RepID=A0ABR1SK94_9PEZI
MAGGNSIPMTRLGGNAFSHSADNDAEKEYDRLRDMARDAAQKRNACFDKVRNQWDPPRPPLPSPIRKNSQNAYLLTHCLQAHQAYERGDGAEAKQLSNEGKRHAAQMEAYNKQASEYIFRENNATGRVADDTIDLHGQFVEEAEDILEARIRDARARGQTHLHVIVGQGHHSAGHVQKIKPRVEQVCRELGLHYATEENAGRIYVDLQGGEVGGMPPPPQKPSGGYAGGGGSGGKHQPQHQQPQHGGQKQPQHGGQQQQQQSRPQQGSGRQDRPEQRPDEDAMDKLFGNVCKNLNKFCCAVM